MIKNTHIQRKNSIVITQINLNEYLIEGNFDLRLGCVVDPIISYADISCGPFIQIGKDFFGKGSVSNIEIISSSINNIIMKVTLYDKEKQNR